MPAYDLSGKVALVTGASSGLGAHFARVLALAGATVVAAARREDALAATAAAIRGAGGVCETLRLDVTRPGDTVFPARVDILVNNAGIAIERAALDQTDSDWDNVIDTNLKGMFLVAQTVARGMRDHGGGAIVNVASILGLRQAGNVAPYAVSKAGALQLTKSLALEWARFGIRVNAIAPGYVDTDINADFWQSDAGRALIRRIPQRRLGRLEDLDGALLLLTSDASAYMTGSVIAIDGGHLVSTL